MISKTTNLTIPKLFPGLIQAIWRKNEQIWLKKTPWTLQKNVFLPILGLKIVFFLRYALKTHFFGFRQTRLNGIISSSYPEVTLDTFGFPVGARLAARRAVFWPRLLKMALFGPKSVFSTLRPYNPFLASETLDSMGSYLPLILR